METICPSSLAEDWDNVGLQVGEKTWPVKKIRISLDPGPDVVKEAIRDKVSILITHHPLIFRPIRSFTLQSEAEQVIREALVHKLSIFSAHTNLDKAKGGVNDALARVIGLKNATVFNPEKNSRSLKLVLFVPAEYEQRMLEALSEAGAGEIMDYTCCSFRQAGKGTFKPGKTSRPFTGTAGQLSTVDEVRIETNIRAEKAAAIIEYVKKYHPYEQMAYDLYPLSFSSGLEGLGRIGDLEQETDLKTFTQFLKKRLKTKSIKYAGNPGLPVKRVAVCGGSGSGLMGRFLSSGAQVYVSGDIGYHDAKNAQFSGRGIVDVGHFASEEPVLTVLAEQVENRLSEEGLKAAVDVYEKESDPYTTI
jgi:dinuclear metal center YbgI/SA1388 family protein